MEASCLCGGIRVAISGKVGALVYCHCKRCQKASGTAFAANVDVRRRYWTFEAGESLVREFDSTPGVVRAFCSRCGSPVYSRRASSPDAMRLRLGSLDADPGRRSLAHCWVRSKAPWFAIGDDLPCHPEGPEATPSLQGDERRRLRSADAIRTKENSMLRGSCLCGTVRYEVRGTPLVMYYCHCGTCRKATGSSFATNVIVSASDFAVVAGRERLAAYESSPEKYRHFCSQCGSPIYSQAEQTRDVVSVRCGTLDDDPGTRPSQHIHVGSKAPWYEIADDLPQQPAGLA
jgi:hypothetical protein